MRVSLCFLFDMIYMLVAPHDTVSAFEEKNKLLKKILNSEAFKNKYINGLFLF